MKILKEKIKKISEKEFSLVRESTLRQYDDGEAFIGQRAVKLPIVRINF